ncbi:MAG TPA: hypothetical protein VNT54_08515 [Solirubrobacteraceae bacterium]|nr:hypothetical protein [Solirubrobacteraceae bacterium]
MAAPALALAPGMPLARALLARLVAPQQRERLPGRGAGDALRHGPRQDATARQDRGGIGGRRELPALPRVLKPVSRSGDRRTRRGLLSRRERVSGGRRCPRRHVCEGEFDDKLIESWIPLFMFVVRDVD